MLFHTWFTLFATQWTVLGRMVKRQNSCYLHPESTSDTADDTSSILEAFDRCGHGGNIVFSDGVFRINHILNTTDLKDCNILLNGELRFSDDISYWLSNSIDVKYQDQSTAWLFGGNNVTFDGAGGFINGNGQAWYTHNRNNSNEPGRPISITFFNSSNLVVKNLAIIQPQFWATFVSHSNNVTMSNISVNATSDDEWSTTNTDGSNTWNADNVLMENWTVTNGDDCIAAKGNTTNLLVRNATCYRSNGMTIGSVGQYPDTPDYLENITFTDVRLVNSRNGAYVKTWQGVSSRDTGIPQGGGAGYIRNVTFRNFELTNVGLPIYLTQCIYNKADADNCDTSRMEISGVTWANFSGTSEYNVVASLHCSGNHPCPDIYFQDVNITSVNATLGLPLYNVTHQEEAFQCANIGNQNTTSGIPCNHWAPNDYGQHPSANVQTSSASCIQGLQKWTYALQLVKLTHQALSWH